MNLLELYVTIKAKDEASDRIGSMVDGIKGKAAGIATAGAAAAAAGVAALGTAAVAVGKQAFDAYASYEQLAGGVEKLYGDAADQLMQYAQEGYRTAGMSVNQYMEQATSFSAALIGSLGGDTKKAAEQTDVAMRSMADNVNVFGSNMEDVQHAYQGFAKQNYTMLDNLKLGYGGTKTEMERLIADANAYGASIGQASDLSIESFSDIVTAIELIQEKQGIAGTTQKEALSTIEGSINATKAAWTNLLTEFGKEDGDVGARIDELIESAMAALENILPRVTEILSKVIDALPEILPKLLVMATQLISQLGQAILEALPTLITTLADCIVQLANYISENTDEFVAKTIEVITAVATALIDALPALIEALAKMIFSLAGAIVNHIPDILGAIGQIGMAILEAIGNLAGDMFQAGVDLIWGLINGILDGLGPLGDALRGVGDFIVQHKGPPEYDKVMLRDNGRLIMGGLVDGVRSGIPELRRTIDDVNGMMSVSGSASYGAGFYGNRGAEPIDYDRMAQAMSIAMSNVGFNVDGRRLATATANAYDAVNGSRQAFANRGLAVM